ncbi:MAG: NAD(P)H-binding protein [Lachnospiraceae bacterium]|jgi:nucleoside-diphosphate-sugar epimerase|nr:NAD(P)H-binding protein [Lachnospiraceae bacterium]MCI8961068.1 NAD(P)H-binding protein [Lachnospiraceae bacterium]
MIIFGVTGGIGKWAVKYAAQSGHNVTAYVRNPSKIAEKSKNLIVVQGEIQCLSGIKRRIRICSLTNNKSQELAKPVNGKMNRLRPPLAAPPVSADRQLRGQSGNNDLGP